jgi:hypothetical protein
MQLETNLANGAKKYEVLYWYQQLKANNLPEHEILEDLMNLTGFSQDLILPALIENKLVPQHYNRIIKEFEIIEGKELESMPNKEKAVSLDALSGKDTGKMPSTVELYISSDNEQGDEVISKNSYNGSQVKKQKTAPTAKEFAIHKKSEEIVFTVSKELYKHIFRTQFGLEYNQVMEIIYKVKIYEKYKETAHKNLSNNHSDIIKQNEQDEEICSTGPNKSEITPQDYGDTYNNNDKAITNSGEGTEFGPWEIYL